MATKEKEFSSSHKFLNVSIRRPGVWFGFVKTMFTFYAVKSRDLLFSENDCHLKILRFLTVKLNLFANNGKSLRWYRSQGFLRGPRCSRFCNEFMSCFCYCVTCRLIARVIFPRIVRLQRMSIISSYYWIINLFS